MKYFNSTINLKIIFQVFIAYTILLSINIYAHYPQTTIIDTININIGLILELLIVTMVIILFSLIKTHILRVLFTIIIFSVYYSVYITQIFSIDLTGNVMNLVSLHNADQVMLLVNNTMMLKSIIYMILFLFILKITLQNKNITFKNILMMVFVLFSTYILVLQYKKSHYFNNSTNSVYSFSPFKNFADLMKFYLQNEKKEGVSELTKKELNIAKKFNIHIDMNQRDPFEKKIIYTDTLAFPSLNETKPNVIVFFIESLSSRLLGSYNDQMKSVTPNIDDFARNSMVVNGYYNHATPTAPGLYGQHCSLYPLLTYEDMNQEVNPLRYLNLKCMPSYFTENDYSTQYFSHSRRHYTNIEKNLKIWGYQKSSLWRNLIHTYLKGEELILGEAGPSDHQMLRGLTKHLNQNIDEPFLIGLSTIEMHMGFKPNAVDGISYKEGENDTLNMMHNFDDAFKIFWDYFKNSKYYDNTIVVLTGDHTLYPNSDYKKVGGDNWIPSVYDEMALIIYDPIHKLPKSYKVDATSVDLAPTILHLAGIKKESANSFMGTSIFDKRDHKNSFGISAYPDFNCYINLNGKILNKKENYIKDIEIKNTLRSLKNIVKYSEFIRNNGKQKED